ncbi:MAG: hypothetical protein VW644_05395, partial [Alphaproteobacteria bacterium]
YVFLLQKTEDESMGHLTKISAGCGWPLSSECQGEVKLIETSRDARLAELEAMRARAKIGAG